MIVFFSHSKVNIFFQSSKLFQNKNALIINSYRKISLRILSKPASSLKMTKKNDRLFQSFFLQIFDMKIIFDYQMILVFQKKLLHFYQKTCQEFSKCIFTKQYFRKNFPQISHVPPYTVFTRCYLQFFNLLRLYSPCTTRTTNPFLHHCVRAASTVLFSFREFGPFLSPHVA